METTSEAALGLFRSMARIRAIEEEICDRYGERNIRGAVHLSIGQEGAAVGVLSATDTSDRAISTHRNHAHYLAKGGSVSAMVDELYGLPSGSSAGWGGSMHLTAAVVGFVGASAVLPGSMPIAVGLGYAARHADEGAIAIGFTGDGAADEGSFFEALNLAAKLGLPVLFVCENNGLSTNTRLEERQAATDLAAKAKAFGLASERISGYDVLEVHAAAARVIASMREDRQPAFLEITVTRMCAHVGPDSWAPRLDADSLANAARAGERGDDPLVISVGRMLAEDPGSEATYRAAVAEAVAEARGEFARGNHAFLAYNAGRGLVAPPPPKSYAV